MYETNLTIEDCKQKLNGELKTLKDNLREDCYMGRVINDKFSFFYHKANRYSNNGILCTGKLIKSSSNTLVKLRFNSMFMSFSYLIIAFTLLIAVLLFNNYNENLPFLQFILMLVKYYSLLLIIFSVFEIITINLPKNKKKIKMMNEFLIDLLKLKRN